MAERDFFADTARNALRTLPEFAPGAGLWARIESAERARRFRTRWARVGLAMAASAVAAVTLVQVQRDSRSTPSETLSGQAESQVLEGQWQQIAASVRSVPSGSVQLRVIDAALQSAYDRDAAPGEILALWRERNRALRRLIDGYRNTGTRDALAVTRI